MSLLPAFNLLAWIDAHRSLLKPPVGNKCIVDGDFIIMIVGGPNHRCDYHVDEGPELFYQLEGEMVLKVQDEGQPRDIPIRAGEMFYLPPNVPHSPRRLPGSIGLVVERKRLPHELDELRWYCPECNHPLFAATFALANIETDLAPLFSDFYDSLQARTCQQCGHIHPLPSR